MKRTILLNGSAINALITAYILDYQRTVPSRISRVGTVFFSIKDKNKLILFFSTLK